MTAAVRKKPAEGSGNLAAVPFDVRLDRQVPELVNVGDLVFERGLQMRTRVNDDTVNDYAEKMQAGAEFPALKIVRVEGVLKVVDGWHRGLSARKAERAQFPAKVLDGTQRDALLVAIAANGEHGLQRTNEDKRRAVVELLKDPEWCKLPSRELAALAKVTHTHVNNVRKQYSVEAGKLLDEDRVAEVDGELPARYANLVYGEASWLHDVVRKVRIAQKPEALLSLVGDHSGTKTWKAIELRLEDLARGEWPWDDKTDPDREKRAKKLDTDADIKRAILARACPNRVALFKVWQAAKTLPKCKESWRLDRIAKEVKGRHRLEELVSERRKALNTSSAPDDPWAVARKLATGPTDALATAMAKSVEAGFYSKLLHYGQQLTDDNRGALRARLEELGVLVTCPDPSCSGFTMRQSSCCICAQYPQNARTRVTEALEHSGRLLSAGCVVVAGGVRIDTSAVQLLDELHACAEFGSDAFTAWVSEAPPALADAMRLVIAAGRNPSPPAGTATRARLEGQVHEDEDEDEEDEDLDEGELDEDAEADLGSAPLADGTLGWCPACEDARTAGPQGECPGCSAQLRRIALPTPSAPASGVELDENCARGEHASGPDGACTNCHEPITEPPGAR